MEDGKQGLGECSVTSTSTLGLTVSIHTPNLIPLFLMKNTTQTTLVISLYVHV